MMYCLRLAEYASYRPNIVLYCFEPVALLFCSVVHTVQTSATTILLAVSPFSVSNRTPSFLLSGYGDRSLRSRVSQVATRKIMPVYSTLDYMIATTQGATVTWLP